MNTGEITPPNRMSSAFWILLLLIGLALTYYLASSSIAELSEVEQEDGLVAATVNGESIPESALIQELLVSYGPRVLNGLVERRVIRQAARKEGVRLSGDELLDLDQRVKGDPNGKFARERYEAQLLLRKLALAGVAEERRREVYETLKEELALYELRVATFDNLDSAKAFYQAYTKGGAYESFETLALTHSPQHSVPRALGKLDAQTIRRRFPGPLAKALLKLDEGRITQPSAGGPDGYWVFRLDHLYDDYLELKRQVGDVVAKERAPRLLKRLLEEAKVESPYLLKEKQTNKSPTPQATPTSS